MPQGHSVHIGLNSVDPAAYEGWDGPLNACEADARSMARICAQAGFTTRTLLTAAATRDAVIEAIAEAANGMASGDTLVVSYSGHGGQLPDLNGDETDALDETWCLYDGQLPDDELHQLWSEFPAGARVVVFSDSCHSGTVIKALLLSGRLAPSLARQPGQAGDPYATPRAMPPGAQLRTYLAHQEQYDALLAKPAPPPAPSCTVVLVSGCQDNQLSYDGAFNGVFTGALLAIWANGNFRGTYQQLTTEVRSQLSPTQSPNYMVIGAPNSPFIEGPALAI
jgi:hypothetical protein